MYNLLYLLCIRNIHFNTLIKNDTRFNFFKLLVWVSDPLKL